MRISSVWLPAAVAAFGFVIFAACEQDPGTGPGAAIEVLTETTGADLDADGYSVEVDGEKTQTVDANGKTVFSGLSAGDHDLELSGVAANCEVNGQNPRTLSVTAGGLVQTTFQVGCVALVASCDYYASPDGAGDGNEGNPFRIDDFWDVSQPGDTLCLNDGTYTGDASMIAPPSDYDPGSQSCLSMHGGTSGQPITIRALNDGAVTIDGETARNPVYLLCQEYLVIEGINAHSPTSANVFHVARSDHNVIRRSVGWDAPEGNHKIFGVHYGEHNLLEDVAGFGIARKTFSSFKADHTTIRRAWGRWEGSHVTGPKLTYTLAYNNYYMLVENAIGTWSGEEQTGSPDQPYAVFGVDRLDDSPVANTRLLGSIAYIHSEDDFAASRLYFVTKVDGVELADNAAWIEPGAHTGKRTFDLYNLQNGQATDLVANALTSVGGDGTYFASEWQVSDTLEGGTVDEIYDSGESLFDATAGAEICYRYQDGVLTSVPLWPWPMDQRIHDALVQAGKTPFYVTDVIEDMFGTIPAACRAG